MASIDELLNMQMQGLMQTRQQPNAFSLLGQALAQASSPNVTGSTFQRIGMVPGLLAQNMAEVRKQELAERRDQIELLRLQRQFQDEEAQRMQRQQLNANIQSLFSDSPLAQLLAQRGDIETALKLSGRLQPSRAEQLAEMQAEVEIQKIKDGEYKTYKLNPETVKRKIGEMIDKDLAAEMDLELAPVAEQLEALELEEYTGTETLKARHWIVDGWMMKKALTLIVGQAGVGKTILMAMLAAALANGQKILGRPIKENGNVLILAAEETKNEIRLRIKAIENLLEHKKTNNKIFIRGLEDQIKLVKFTMAEAKATKEYLQLQLAIKKHNIKFILLDPLISFQTGAYDENNNAKMEQFVKDFLIPLAVENNGCIVAGHHTNKFSMITITDGELLVDHQVALNAARGASSLVAAARFVLAIQPMTKKLFKDKFQDHIKDGSKFTNYAGLIEAKSNYSITEDEIDWLKKNSVSLEVVNEDGESANESLGVFTTSDINKIAKAKNKLKAEKNEAFAKSQIPLIKSLMVNDECTLNAAVEQVLMKDPEFADTNVDEKTIKSRVRRQLVNGLNGSAETKNGMTAQGISYDDGYNYWVKVDNSRDGAAKYFIQRGKDFSK